MGGALPLTLPSKAAPVRPSLAAAIIPGDSFSQQGCREASPPPWEGPMQEGLLRGRVLRTPRAGPGWGSGEEACSRVDRGPPGLADHLFWGIQLGINPQGAPFYTKPPLPAVPFVPTEGLKGERISPFPVLPVCAVLSVVMPWLVSGCVGLRETLRQCCKVTCYEELTHCP